MRSRIVWQKISKTNAVHTTRPSNIGARRNLYSLSDSKDIDKWSYEKHLQHTLNSMRDEKSLTLDDFLHIAVPFIAGLFVRGKEFNRRYENMRTIRGLSKEKLIHPDNTNTSRIIRLQKLLAPVLTARWVVLHNSNPKHPIISNDLSLTLTLDILSNDMGWAIPLDPQTILGIFPKKERPIATFTNEVWLANIEHYHPPPEAFHDLNKQITDSAHEFIFGPSKESLEDLELSGSKTPQELAYIMEMPWTETFNRDIYNRHDCEWFYLAGIANKNYAPSSKEEYVFELTDALSGNKWKPHLLILPGNKAVTGISFRGDNLHMDLF